MTLRRRLVIGTLLLLIAGLAATDLVTYSSLRSFLYGRTDAQLDTAQGQVYETVLRYQMTRDVLPDAQIIGSHVSPDIYVLVIGDNGTVLVDRPSSVVASTDPTPIFPSTLPLRPSPNVPPDEVGKAADLDDPGVGGTGASGPVTITTIAGLGHMATTTLPGAATTSTAGPGKGPGAYRPSSFSFEMRAVGRRGSFYRAEAVAVEGGVLVVATPLLPLDQTLTSLVHVELLVSGAVAALLCALVLLIVRWGLRPLDDMTETAGAIAAGELSSRVASGDAATEVGRLGLSLNSMLAQIEAAFAERSSSENRLRQFVADASHELRTPLTSIRGYAELLRKGAFTDEEGRTRALGRIEDEASRMGGIVDDLLLLARLDQGRKLEVEPVDLGRIATLAVEDARMVAPERSIRLRVVGPVVVVGDHDRLGQVAHNLLRNAMVHTAPDTPVDVDVDVAVGDGANKSMGALRVRDHGAGLTADQASRVFDRFYRGSSARTGGGTGLGLAIVAAIAKALRGSASMVPVDGAGACFEVMVPLWGGNTGRLPLSTGRTGETAGGRVGGSATEHPSPSAPSPEAAQSAPSPEAAQSAPSPEATRLARRPGG